MNKRYYTEFHQVTHPSNASGGGTFFDDEFSFEAPDDHTLVSTAVAELAGEIFLVVTYVDDYEPGEDE